MKTVFKNILVLILAVCASVVAPKSADLSTNASAGIGPLIAGKVQISDITIFNNSAGIALVHLYDAPGNRTNLSYITTAYTVNGVTGPTSIVTTYTNVFGTVENWTNSALSNVIVTNAAATNTYPRIVSFQIATNASARWVPSSPTFTSLGLISSNSAAVVINVNYNR